MSGVPKSLTVGIMGEYGLEAGCRGSWVDPSTEGVCPPGRIYRTELTDPFRPSLPRILACRTGTAERCEAGGSMGTGACRRFSKER